MGHKEDQEIREQEVMKRVHEFLKRQDLNYFYGFSAEDVERLVEAFSSLVQNNDTTFPDFYSSNSCVELFSVSSSISERKGSAQMKQDGKLRVKIAQDDEKAVSSCDFKRRTYLCAHPEHTYEALTNNLREQVAKHVGSKRACSKQFDTSVFVIDLNELDLCCMFRPLELVVLDGLRIGDLESTYADGKPYGLYRLSRDRENLEWLAQYVNDVNYVVFCGLNVIEAINLHHVREIVAFLPWKLVTAANNSLTFVSSAPLVNEGLAGSHGQD